ncbi:MAG: four helix bundle protein [Bdellovibrionales bacterium]
MIHSFKDLDVWKKAICFVTDIYRLSQTFPKEERYGLVSQMRRAAISIPSNIAEGRGKRSTKDFIRYLNIAYGSSAELETQLIIANNLGYAEEEGVEALVERLYETNRMLSGLISSLEKKQSFPKCQMLNARSFLTPTL